jgi:hypothetical protein
MCNKVQYHLTEAQRRVSFSDSMDPCPCVGGYIQSFKIEHSRLVHSEVGLQFSYALSFLLNDSNSDRHKSRFMD